MLYNVANIQYKKCSNVGKKKLPWRSGLTRAETKFTVYSLFTLTATFCVLCSFIDVDLLNIDNVFSTN